MWNSFLDWTICFVVSTVLIFIGVLTWLKLLIMLEIDLQLYTEVDFCFHLLNDLRTSIYNLLFVCFYMMCQVVITNYIKFCDMMKGWKAKSMTNMQVLRKTCKAKTYALVVLSLDTYYYKPSVDLYTNCPVSWTIKESFSTNLINLAKFSLNSKFWRNFIIKEANMQHCNSHKELK